MDLRARAREQAELINNMTVAAIAALFLIYALIAIPLHSYSQPLVIMSVIPFGVIGAVLGHLLMGKAISMFSLFGLIALAGVVVNDSLIMIDFVNKAREAGAPLRQAVIDSGTRRFRAIFLTSITTAAGLMPILLEKSTQAGVRHSNRNIAGIRDYFRNDHHAIPDPVAVHAAGRRVRQDASHSQCDLR